MKEPGMLQSIGSQSQTWLSNWTISMNTISVCLSRKQKFSEKKHGWGKDFHLCVFPYFTYFLIESSSRVKTILTCRTQEGNHCINLNQRNVNCACLVHMARWSLGRDCCRAKTSTFSFMGVQFSKKKVGLPFNSMPSWKILHLTSVFGTFVGYNMDYM